MVGWATVRLTLQKTCRLGFLGWVSGVSVPCCNMTIMYHLRRGWELMEMGYETFSLRARQMLPFYCFIHSFKVIDKNLKLPQTLIAHVNTLCHKRSVVPKLCRLLPKWVCRPEMGGLDKGPKVSGCVQCSQWPQGYCIIFPSQQKLLLTHTYIYIYIAPSAIKHNYNKNVPETEIGRTFC